MCDSGHAADLDDRVRRASVLGSRAPDEASGVIRTVARSIPQDYWNRARCVITVPELKKAAFIVGGEYRKGVMSCRAGDSWSAPVFTAARQGELGLSGRS